MYKRQYPPQAGVKTWQRQVQLNGGAVEISDAFTLGKAPDSLQQVFMTVCPMDLSQPGQVRFLFSGNKKLVLTYDPALWVVTAAAVPLTTPEDETITQKWEGRIVSRVLLTHRKPAAASQHRFVFVVE